MTEYDWDDFEDGEEGEEQTPQVSPGSLPKELRRVIRDAKKSEKAALEKAANLESQLRKNAVEGVLTARNVPAKVAKLIPSEVEATPDAISKWLDEYGDVFGVQPGGQQAAQESAPNGQNADIAAMQRMQSTASSGEAFNGSQQELLAKLSDPSLTEEQLDALIAGAKR